MSSLVPSVPNRPTGHGSHESSTENGSVSGAIMYDPLGQHPVRAPLVPRDSHLPPHNVPLNPLLWNTIQAQRRVIPTNMTNKRETNQDHENEKKQLKKKSKKK